MFFPKSQNDFALNLSDEEAIVYRDANYVLHRLTKDDFASEKEFRRWKRWSNTSYHMIFKGDRNFYEHKVSLGRLEFTLGTTYAAQLSFLQQLKRHLLYLKVHHKLRKILNQTQYRRFIMAYELNLSQSEIAEIEGVSQAMISKSISSAEKKIRENFVNKL